MALGSQGARTTHVYVSPQVTNASVAPDFSSVTQPRATGSATARTSKKTAPGIQWGSVVKGAAIVTAVVAVAVVGATLLPMAVGAVPGLTAGLQAAGGGLAVAADIAGGIASVAWHSLVSFGAAATAGFAATAPAALTTATAAATMATVSSGTVATGASMVGALGAGAAVLPTAIKQMSMLDFVDHSAAHTNSTADLAANSTLAAKKTVVINQHPNQHFANAVDPANMPDPSDSMLDESMQTSNKAMKVVHHAAEDNHEHQKERSARTLLSRSTEANRSWTERTASARAPVQPITSRAAASFTENLELDTARAQSLNDLGRA